MNSAIRFGWRRFFGSSLTRLSFCGLAREFGDERTLGQKSKQIPDSLENPSAGVGSEQQNQDSDRNQAAYDPKQHVAHAAILAAVSRRPSAPTFCVGAGFAHKGGFAQKVDWHGGLCSESGSFRKSPDCSVSRLAQGFSAAPTTPCTTVYGFGVLAHPSDRSINPTQLSGCRFRISGG